jgi:hypothetical protein
MFRRLAAWLSFALMMGCAPAPAPPAPAPIVPVPADDEPQADDERRGVHVDVGGVKVDVQRKPDEPQE